MAIYGPYYAGSVSYGITTNPSNVLGAPNGSYGSTTGAGTNIGVGGFGCAVNVSETLTGMRVKLYGYISDGALFKNWCFPEWYDAFNESWTFSNFLVPSPLLTTTPGSVTLGSDSAENYDGLIGDLNDPLFGLYFEFLFDDAPATHTLYIDAVELKIYTDGSLEPSGNIAKFRRRRSFRGG